MEQGDSEGIFEYTKSIVNVNKERVITYCEFNSKLKEYLNIRKAL
jgi:hypothetical protein